MNKIVASILSLTILSCVFTNTSFAKKYESTDPIQKSLPDKFNSNSQDLFNIQDSVKENKTEYFEKVNDQKLIKNNNFGKKSAREETIENLKNNLKKYIGQQQKLIQKYENMTDIKFNLFTFFISFLYSYLGALVGNIVGTIVGLLIEKSMYKFYYEGYERGYKIGKKYCQTISYFHNNFNVLTYNKKLIELIKNILVTLHPDKFLKKLKTFDDIKDLYYEANDFYEVYLK